MNEIEDLQVKVDGQSRIIAGLERILKLNEKELANATEMVQVYERITEFSRQEMKGVREAAQAQEAASNLSSQELNKAFGRIQELEVSNEDLREQQSRIKQDQG